MEKKSVFATLNAINCNEHTEKKQGLTYLSWAWAWAEIKKAYPEAFYTIYENQHGWNYHTDGKTCWVKTGVTIEDIEHIEYLPVMDYRNKSIALADVTSFDVNKAIQRSLTKACARHGLGLYIYAGEDLPETPTDKAVQQAAQKLEDAGLPMEYTQVKADESKVNALLIEISEKKTKAEIKALMQEIKSTPEFSAVRNAALQRYQLLKA